MTTRIVTDANGRKHITNEPLLHPPQPPWIGLTDEEIQYCVELKNPEAIAEEVEAKLKEKNT